MMANVQLYSSPISDCAARLRLALNIKGIVYNSIAINLKDKENFSSEYRGINPARTVPTLLVSPMQSADQTPLVLTQSIATLEYLDEAFPETISLLPPISQPVSRMKVRSLVNIIATDIHPLTTHRVGRAIADFFPCDDSADAAANGNRKWDSHWIVRGLSAYEAVSSDTAGQYSFGNNVTLADICLLPELWTAERLGIDIKSFPTIFRVFKSLSALPQVLSARQDPALEL